MKFVGGEVEPCFTRWRLPVRLSVSGRSSLPSLGLLWKLLGVKVVAKLSTEVAEGGSEWFCQGVKVSEPLYSSAPNVLLSVF